MFIAYPTNKDIEHMVVILNDDKLIADVSAVKGNHTAKGIAWKDGIYIVPKDTLFTRAITGDDLCQMRLDKLQQVNVTSRLYDFLLGHYTFIDADNEVKLQFPNSNMQKRNLHFAISRSAQNLTLIPLKKESTRITTKSGVITIGLTDKSVSVDYAKGQKTLLSEDNIIAK